MRPASLLWTLALVAPLAAMPHADASPPLEPWDVLEARATANATAGAEAFDLTLRALVRGAGMRDATLALEAPSWLRIEGDRNWTLDASGDAERESARTWTIVPQRAGFWAVRLHADDGGYAWCCAYGATLDNGTFATLRPDGIVPAVTLAGALHVEGPPERFRLSYDVVPPEGWLRHATLRVAVLQGPTYLCDTCAVALPDGRHVASGPGDAPLNATGTFDLAEGDAFTLSTEARIAFDAPPGAGAPRVAYARAECVNVRLAPVEDRVVETERWGCGTPSEEWYHVLPLHERIARELPAPPLALLLVATVAAMALAGAQRR